MRQKLITALGIVLAFTLIFSAQAGYAFFDFHPKHHNKPNPTTSPTTGPVTGPVTGPITGPASLFVISGNVKYHLLGVLKKSVARYLPAPAVTVKAKDIFNGHSATATTDSNGNYIINAGQPGLYKVTVSGGQTNTYVPPLQVVHLKEKKPTKTNVNFEGLIFKFQF